jgi:thiol-disulfide isomerase/thioredoxin
MRENLFLVFLSLIIILATILFFVSSNNKVSSSNYLEVIKNAPAMLDLTNNKEVKLKDYIGKYMVLEVWEIWCPACKKAIPELIKFNQDYPKLNSLKNNVVFFSFLSNSSGSNNDIINFVKQNGINYPVLLDNNYYIGKNFGAKYIPSLFIVDKDGNLRYTKVGPEKSSILQAELLKIIKK